MTGSSWFRGSSGSSGKPLSLTDTIKLLQPPSLLPEAEGRFSQLLLENGETRIQDWAVVASSSPSSAPNSSDHDASSLAATAPAGEIQWAQSPHRRRRTKTTTPTIQMSSSSSSSTESRSVTKESCPTAFMHQIEGRLHLCSHSLVFEPHDTARPIVRCPRDSSSGKSTSSRHQQQRDHQPFVVAGEGTTLEMETNRHTAMKAHNAIAPFVAVPVPVRFQFAFVHSSPEELMRKIGKHGEKEALSAPPFTAFDPDCLVNMREHVRTHSMRAAILTPLQRTPGVLVVTNERLYWQQQADRRVTHWKLEDIAATARRYHGLRDCAVEVYWRDQTSTLFALDRRHEREQVLRVLPAEVVCVTDRSFVKQASAGWHAREISNREYLLALNAAAGRSFHDLSRYPVMPWVITDYKSSKLDLQNPSVYRDFTKPVGALNTERLDYFRKRWEQMQEMQEEDEFLYGTHYSAPGYVLYFLVRSMPEHMLCLQNGKYDAPDRMFHSLTHCFDCVLTNHADVKELIPEFYGNDFDFLLNTRGLSLGATQNGERVNDVSLPPWARSPRHFLATNRKALESEYCTKHLSAWIDLIFGTRARGQEAKDANNLFHSTSYMGPTDLADMQTEAERAQAELQATEFGIVPDQLFVETHPAKSEPFRDEVISRDLGRANSKDDSGGREAWELLDPPSSQDDNPSGGSMSSNHMHNEVLIDDPNHTQVEDTFDQRQNHRGTNDQQHASSVGTRAFSSQGSISPAQALHQTPSASSWDMKVLESISVHNDAVSACVLRLDPNDDKQSILATTSLDGGLKVHHVPLLAMIAQQDSKVGFSSTLSRFYRGPGSEAIGKPRLTEYRTHTSRDQLASLVLAKDGSGGSVAFAGGHDDIVLAYGINSACAMASVYSHRDAVTGLDLIARPPQSSLRSHGSGDNSSVLWRDNSTHVLVSCSWDATVKIWSVAVAAGETVSVNREPLAELVDANSSIVSVSAASLEEGAVVVAAGCADGSFCVWNVHEDCVPVVLHNEPAKRGSGPCSVVEWITVGGKMFLLAAFSTGKVASYSFAGDSRLERRQAVSVGVAVLSMVYFEDFLLVGCADGGLRLIPVRDGFYFSSPTLWPAVHKAGMTSMSVAATNNRCFCCTGGDDGSVVLFELKQA